MEMTGRLSQHCLGNGSAQKISTFTHRLLNATLIESQVKFSSPKTSMEPHRKAMLRQTTEGTAEMNYGAHLAHPKIDVIRGLLQGCATFP